MSLHTEMCESGEVTSVEEEPDSGNMTSRRERSRSKQHYAMPPQQKISRNFVKRPSRGEWRVSRRKRESRRNQEPGAAQQHRTADTLKEVAETQQVRSRQRKENLQNNRRMKT